MTSAKIAFNNLNVQVTSQEHVFAGAPGNLAAARSLVDLLLARGEYTSRIADYEHASEVADAIVKAKPGAGDAHTVHARALGTFHLFSDALAELDAATAAKGSPGPIRAARATAYMAEGRFDDADALGLWKDTANLDASGLAAAAILAGERAQADVAEQLFDQARAAYRDVSPFPLAWMDFQRGQLLERWGEKGKAKAYFAEAHDLLPEYGHPAVHLAGLDTPADAVSILEPLIGQVDDPQIDAAYADALRRVGRTDDSSKALARAKVRYDELVQKHPLAFADHAAQFYLGLGQDPAKALVLARVNAKNRPTEPAIDLWMTAALAAGSRDEACTAAAQGALLHYATAAFKATVTTTRAGCDGKGGTSAANTR
jgi:tetratricopeptide (TPR) repeat protein